LYRPHISDNGASIEFNNVVNLPREQISLRIARKAALPRQGGLWRDISSASLSAPKRRPSRFRSGRTAAQERNKSASFSAASRNCWASADRFDTALLAVTTGQCRCHCDEPTGEPHEPSVDGPAKSRRSRDTPAFSIRNFRPVRP
jgi:hypothetical protein